MSKNDNVVEISDHIKMKEKIEGPEVGLSKEWNDMITDWLGDYENKLKESLEKNEITIDEYKDSKKNMLDLKYLYIDDKYIDNLIEYLDDLDVSYINGKIKVDNKSDKFDKFVENTCRKNVIDTSMFMDCIDRYLEMSCENEREKKEFKAILFDLTKHDSVMKSVGNIESHQIHFKFLKLFLYSMKEYSMRLFNSIVEKYLKIKEN